MKIKMKRLCCCFISFAFLCFSVCAINLQQSKRANAEENENSNYAYTSSSVSNLSVMAVANDLCITGQIEEYAFELIGKLYYIYDNFEANKYYFIDNNTNDFNSQFYMLNLEYELNINSYNVTNRNQELFGKNVIKLAVFIEDEVYYVEQEFNIDKDLLNNAIQISMKSNNDILKTIVSNSAWFTHLYEKVLVEESPSFIQTRATGATPQYGVDLDPVDRDVIQKIGISQFDQEQYIHGWTRVNGKITGGYVLESVEWPLGSGSILTYCLFYEITANVPNQSSNLAELQFQLIADRQYRWYPDDNVVEPYMQGTDFRLYNVKLAIECAQFMDEGYDYISSRSVYINSTSIPCEKKDIALSIAKQFDKYNIISYTELIFDSFSESDEDSGYSECIWATDLDEHYASVANGKRSNTMVRGVRVDTKDHKIVEENNLILLKAGVVDRDYNTSSTNVSMMKAIKFAFSYNLRSRNVIFQWLFKGDDCGEIGGETYKTYRL